ncbi:MAG TPA: hypothetical protein VK524_32920 [Polyangiaceae bacterium]|nr:hypothetical protein [Polyangiaceae bacterium]
MSAALHRALAVALLAGGLVACGSTSQDTAPGPVMAEFGSEPPAPGYTRFYTPSLTLAPGESRIYAQWVAPPAERDQYVLDVRGKQTAGGHHALLHATSITQPSGFTGDWPSEAHLTTRFLGGVPGPGGESFQLPEGAVFLLRKGESLVVQVHHMNPTHAMREARSYLDVKLLDPTPNARVVALFNSTTLSFLLEPGRETSHHMNCRVREDLEILMYANHMHELGSSALTEAVYPDGITSELKRDDVWDHEWGGIPNYTHAPAGTPLHIPAGTLLRTRCTWQNPGTQTVRFPDEMCGFFGFFYSESDIQCTNEKWDSRTWP